MNLYGMNSDDESTENPQERRHENRTFDARKRRSPDDAGTSIIKFRLGKSCVAVPQLNLRTRPKRKT